MISLYSADFIGHVNIWRVQMQKPVSAIWNFLLIIFIKLVYLSSVISLIFFFKQPS